MPEVINACIKKGVLVIKAKDKRSGCSRRSTFPWSCSEQAVGVIKEVCADMRQEHDIQRQRFFETFGFLPKRLNILSTSPPSQGEEEGGIPHKNIDGKNVALIFEKTSTRTSAASKSRARPWHGRDLSRPSGSQIGKKEHRRHGARALGHIRRH